MAIAKLKPTAIPPQLPELPKAAPDNYKGTVYDDKYVPHHSLLAYVDGMPWTVDYYAQVLGKHNEIRELDTGEPGVSQSYTKTIGLELRVDSDLSTSHDSTSQKTSVTGTALIYPFIQPNVNDLFVAEAGLSRKALFSVTSINRRTLNRDSLFEIEYRMIGYITVPDVDDKINNLETKTIRIYHFDKGRLLEGLSPYLKEDDYKQVTSLRTKITDLTTFYFQTFFNRRYTTLVIPGQLNGIYDHFLVTYLLKIVDSLDAPEIRMIKQIPVDNDPNMQQPQFWSLMMNRNYEAMWTLNRYMTLVTKNAFNQNSYIQGLAYNSIDFIVYPVMTDQSLLVGQAPTEKPLSYSSLQPTEQGGPSSGMFSCHPCNLYVGLNNTTPLYKLVTEDDSYVLSDDFYGQTDNQCILEILTKDYLKGNTIDLHKLDKLYEGYKTLPRLEQYYYGPILLTLLKEANRRVYS